MYKLDLPVDMRESAAIARRRQREIERQSRIFNARVRTIGVDLQALEQQVAERKRIEDEECRRNDAFAADMLRNDKICSLLQKRQENDIRQLNKSINEFRKNFQQPESRREFDIHDPESKKKHTPARVSDDDPRCGVSSMQKFLGEDLNEQQRKKVQQEQMREWARQQITERSQEKANMEQASRFYDLRAIQNDQRAMELGVAEQECRRTIDSATKNYNLALAREKQANKDAEKRQEMEDNFTEISNQIFSDMLTENPAVAQSAFGSHRVISDRWKGMSPEEISNIRHTQKLQIEEAQRLRSEEKQRNEKWDAQRLAQAKAALILERQQERLRKELNKLQADANLRFASEQKAQLEYVNKELYTNQPTADYFMQFNTSSR